jgi:ferredoxin
MYTVYENFVKKKWCHVGREQREYPVYLIKVDRARCNGCGECADFCPVDIFVGNEAPFQPAARTV